MSKNIYQTAVMVTVFSICERFLGFLYRIILSRTIGSEGMGLYQLSLTVFAVFITITSSGIPITVSRLIAGFKTKKNLQGEQSTVTAAILVTLIFSVPIFILFFFGHSLFSFLFTDPRCSEIFSILLISLTFNSVYAVLRGSFWGNRQFFAYSVIELVEEMVMIVFGTIFVLSAVSVLDGARKAAWAVVISYTVSFSSAMIYFFCKGGKLKNPKGSFKPLLSSAMPITAMRASSSLVNSLISMLLPARLVAIGMTNAQALSAYGVVYGMAIPLLFVPSTIIGSIALVLVPELAENYSSKNYKGLCTNIEKAVKITALIAFFLIPLFFVLGDELGILVYSNVESGQVIKYSCFMLLPMSLTMITNSILNSMGQEKKTLLYYLIGALTILLCVFFLPKYCGVYSLCIGLGINYSITMILNLRLIRKKCPIKPKYIRYMLLLALVCACELIFGVLLSNILSRFMGMVPTMILCSSCMIIIIAIVLRLLGVYSFRPVKKLFAKSS